MQATLSIIIPAYNEHDRIGMTVAHLLQLFDPTTSEIIVVDQSADASTKQQLSNYPDVIYTRSRGNNRGSNLHQGAQLTTGKLLLFLHADTHLPQLAGELLPKIDLDTYCYGAFSRRFDTQLPWISRLGNKLHLRIAKTCSYCYGDQAIFVSKEAYEAIGGFKPQGLFEDVDLTRRLSRYAKKVDKRFYWVKQPVTTSSRKFARKGAWKTIAFMLWISILYHSGVDPDKLVLRYQRW